MNHFLFFAVLLQIVLWPSVFCVRQPMKIKTKSIKQQNKKPDEKRKKNHDKLIYRINSSAEWALYLWIDTFINPVKYPQWIKTDIIMVRQELSVICYGRMVNIQCQPQTMCKFSDKSSFDKIICILIGIFHTFVHAFNWIVVYLSSFPFSKQLTLCLCLF